MNRIEIIEAYNRRIEEMEMYIASLQQTIAELYDVHLLGTSVKDWPSNLYVMVASESMNYKDGLVDEVEYYLQFVE